MTVQLSPVLDAEVRGNDAFSIKALDLAQLAEPGCPVVAVDEFARAVRRSHHTRTRAFRPSHTCSRIRNRGYAAAAHSVTTS